MTCWKLTDVHDEIRLRKEPDNPYDPFAVKVLCDRKHLGYVPAELSKEVTELINKKMIYIFKIRLFFIYYVLVSFYNL